MTKNKILMQVAYNQYIELPKSVSAEAILDLMAINICWHTDYNNENYNIQKFDSQILSVPSNCFIESDNTINIDEILSENNRLTRENEILKSKLTSTDNKELVL
jgi:hypothetical protein